MLEHIYKAIIVFVTAVVLIIISLKLIFFRQASESDKFVSWVLYLPADLAGKIIEYIGITSFIKGDLGMNLQIVLWLFFYVLSIYFIFVGIGIVWRFISKYFIRK